MLACGGVQSCLGESVGSQDLAVAQPGLEPFLTHPAQGCRGLVAGQQRERTSVGEVQGPLQTGADAAQLGAETVDGASAVGDQVRATPCEDLEVRDGFVADT